MIEKTDILSTTHRGNTAIADKYLNWHCFILLGYAFCGRGFSYWGVSPLFIGEITLAFGLATLSLNKSFPKLLKQYQTWYLIAFMVWCCINTVPYFPAYGLFSIRDAALWYYCFFALIIGTLLVSKPRRFQFMVEQYKRFSRIFLVLMPFLWFISKSVPLPPTPGSSVKLIALKPADTMTHFAGITAFFLGSNLINTQITFFILMFFINLGLVAASANRSGTLAFLNSFALVSFTKAKLYTLPSNSVNFFSGITLPQYQVNAPAISGG